VTVAAVVRDFKAALPGCRVFVFDNNSTDNTAAIAREAGAVVRAVNLQGKGHVVRRLFADIDAEVFVMVDGDATYDAAAAPKVVQAVLDGADMVVGLRVAQNTQAYRAGHVLGNRLLTGFLSWLFGRACNDILSGYRGFSRRFVKSFPILSAGFEIETELTVHALELKAPIAEVETRYFDRPEGSVSKLSTYADGWRILKTMLRLFAAERPLVFFGGLGALVALASIGLAVPVVLTWLQTGLVPRFPTAILSAAMMIVAITATASGLILDTVTRGRREFKMLAYLAQRDRRLD
jgi:glycosyltransferase involved in cell wall biosynthesis